MMWWFFKKIADNKEIIKYKYGFETKELNGIVCYDRKNDVFFLEKLADGDNELIAKKFLYNHIYDIIFNEDAPLEKQIAIS